MTTKVEPLARPTNNVNKVFIVPDIFLPGSTRIIWNGNVYFATDAKYGFTETGPAEITTFEAPRTGDVLLLIYRINAGSSPSTQHADGVYDLIELADILQADREDKQLRLVELENSIYRFDVGAITGGIAPNDIDDGRWFQTGSQLITFIGSPFDPNGVLP